MKKVAEKPKYFLIALFSIWFLVFPSYFYFSTLDDADINSVSSFENIDEENSTPNLGKNKKVAGSTFLIKHMFMDFLFLTQVPNLFFQLQTSTAKTLILRC